MLRGFRRRLGHVNNSPSRTPENGRAKRMVCKPIQFELSVSVNKKGARSAREPGLRIDGGSLSPGPRRPGRPRALTPTPDGRRPRPRLDVHFAPDGD